MKRRSPLQTLKWINDRFKACQCQKALLSNCKKVDPKITKIIRSCDLDIVKKISHQFDKGYTCVWLLRQSHVALHSWPEYNFLTLNIEVCNFKGDDPFKIDELYSALRSLFKPKSTRPRRSRLQV